MTVTVSGPTSVSSGIQATFRVQSDVPLTVLDIALVWRRPLTGGVFAEQIVRINRDIASSPYDRTIRFNDFPQADDIMEPVCGDGSSPQLEVVLFFSGGSSLVVAPFPFSLIRTADGGGCFDSEVRMFRHTAQQTFDCMGVDGIIGLRGQLVKCGNIFGVGVCQAFGGARVRIGLMSPGDNPFFAPMIGNAEVITSTDLGSVGVFSIGFRPSDLPGILDLVPATGERQFLLVARFEGDGVTRRGFASATITIKGREAAPCFTGTPLLARDFPEEPPVPAGGTVHEVFTAFTAGVTDILGTAEAVADQVVQAVRNEGAHPVRVEIFQGPNVDLVEFFGLGLIPVPTLNVKVLSWSNPVPVAVIALAILAALIVLGIIVFLIFQTIKETVEAGGEIPLALIALAVIGVAGAGVYALSRRKRK